MKKTLHARGGALGLAVAAGLFLAGVILVTAASSQTSSVGAIRDSIREKRADLQRARVHDCREERTHWRFDYVSRIPRSRLGRNHRYIIGRVRDVRAARPLCRESLWQCVHAHEGSWTDPNPLYFGGLQMGAPFAAAYGDRQSFGRNIYAGEGTPDNWTEREQIAVADGALRENGGSIAWLDSQWPGTSSECGAHL